MFKREQVYFALQKLTLLKFYKIILQNQILYYLQNAFLAMINMIINFFFNYFIEVWIFWYHEVCHDKKIDSES